MLILANENVARKYWSMKQLLEQKVVRSFNSKVQDKIYANNWILIFEYKMPYMVYISKGKKNT